MAALEESRQRWDSWSSVQACPQQRPEECQPDVGILLRSASQHEMGGLRRTEQFLLAVQWAQQSATSVPLCRDHSAAPPIAVAHAIVLKSSSIRPMCTARSWL